MEVDNLAGRKESKRSREMKLQGCKMEVGREQREQTKHKK
jgi:hypothetical protein